jgi:hypothetical protein
MLLRIICWHKLISMNRKLSVRIASILLILHGLIELAGLVFINSMPHALISFGGLTGPALKQNAATTFCFMRGLEMK